MVAANGEVVEVKLRLHVLRHILPVVLVGVYCQLHHGTHATSCFRCLYAKRTGVFKFSMSSWQKPCDLLKCGIADQQVSLQVGTSSETSQAQISSNSTPRSL